MNAFGFHSNFANSLPICFALLAFPFSSMGRFSSCWGVGALLVSGAGVTKKVDIHGSLLS